MADRKISDLTALTTPASGDYLPIVDISEAAAASKNKRITIEELFRGVPLGTAAAPSIAFEGDENTGIYSPGADQLALATNGAECLRVTSDGKLGLGISSPTNILHVVGTGRFNVSGSNNVVIASDSGEPFLYTEQAAGLKFGTNSAVRMTINSSGSVGLGTTSPSSLLHLADAGDITVGTTTGTKIGTATTQKLGFYNATPVVQPAAVADATDAATVITQLNDLLAKLRTLGLIAT